jgi:uncharacterized delta-60 repeat protein
MKRILGILAVSVAFAASFAMPAAGATKPGSLDRSFGASAGRTLFGAPSAATDDAYLTNMIGLADGSTISSSWGGQFKLGRVSMLIKQLPDGSPDPGFGDDGTRVLPSLQGVRSNIEDMATQGGSTITLSQGAANREGTLFLQRIDDRTGKRDLTFGKGGMASATIGSYVPKDAEYRFDPIGVEVDRKGRIYFAGSVGYSNGTTVLIRLTAAGKLDRSFGQKGAALFKPGKCDPPNRFQVTADGVYTLSTNCLNRLDPRGRPDPSFSYDPVNADGRLGDLLKAPDGTVYVVLDSGSEFPESIRKLEEDGSIDRNFGASGELVPDVPGYQVTGISIDPSGRFLFFLATDPYYPGPTIAIARLMPDGSLDPSFGGDGIGELPPDINGTEWRTPGFVSDGLVFSVVAGNSYPYSPMTAKLQSDGTMDPDYGESGVATVRPMLPPADRIIDTVTMTDGGTVAAGRSELEAAFVRYRSNGKLDTSWADHGVFTLRTGNSQYGDEVQSVTRTADGGALGCIESQPGVWIVRLDPEGRLDSTFDGDGTLKLAGMLSCAGITALPDGKTLVGGSGTGWVPAVTRLNEDGSPDPSYGVDGWAIGDQTGAGYRDRFAFAGFQDGSALISTSRAMTKFTPDGDWSSEFGNGGVAALPRSKDRSYPEGPKVIARAPGGGLFLGASSSHSATIVKLKANGSPARRFGRGSVVALESSHKLELTDLKVQGDGRPVLSTSGNQRCAGWFKVCRQNLRVLRLTRSGKPDRSFAKKGSFEIRPGLISRANSLTLTGRGIVVGGYVETGTGRDDFLLLRLKR